VLGEQIIITDGNKIVNQTGGVVAGRCVVIDTTDENKVKYPTASNARLFAGVVQDKSVDNGKPVTLAIFGDVKCIAASAINIGDEVYLYGTAGKIAAVPLESTPVDYYWSIGVALDNAAQDGDQVLVRLHGNTRQVYNG